MAKGLKIGALAQAASCPIETIHYYEQQRLLPKPERSQGNFRLYDEIHVARLSFIRRCRSLDMSLDEIRLLLRFCDRPDDNCDDVNHLLDEHIGHVAERIKDLQQLQKQLKELRRACGKPQAAKHCGILRELAHIYQATGQGKKRASHVHGSHAHRRAARN